MCTAAQSDFYPALWALDPRLWPYQGMVARVESTEAAEHSHALARAMERLIGTSNRHEQWSALFAPSDVVGIKVNCRLGPGHSTSPRLVDAIAANLTAIGIPPGHIIVFDRRNDWLRECGFTLNTGSGAVRCFGVEDVFDEALVESGGVAGRFSMIVSRMCTALISAHMARPHPLDGIDGCVRNLFNAIHNPHKLNVATGDPVAADFLAVDPIRSRWRLAIGEGGGALAISADPVAHDATLLHALAALNYDPSWFQAAMDRGLGSLPENAIKRGAT